MATRRQKSGLTDRPTGDLLVLMIASTVCFFVVLGVTVIGVLALMDPDREIGIGFTRITGVINTMVGLLAGFLAGRSEIGRRNGNTSP